MMPPLHLGRGTHLLLWAAVFYLAWRVLKGRGVLR